MMLNKPKITVITVCYNTEAYISEAITSVLNQTTDSFEYLIIDDHSTDTSWEKIKSFTDARIRAYRNEKNLGEYPNRNQAVSLATGDYILFIDGDDILYPNAIETFHHYIRLFPKSSMFFCRAWEPRIIYPYELSPETIYRFEYLDRGIIGQNFTRVLFKRNDIIENGCFPEGISTGDAYMQLKIGLKNTAVVVHEGLAWWRRRRGNATDRFFAGNKHVVEVAKYRLDFLNDPYCPLNEKEKELAKTRVYATYLRRMLQLMSKFQVRDASYLFKQIQVPRHYYKSILKPSHGLYFGGLYGEKPLQTPIKDNQNHQPSNKEMAPI